jgi:hypothetical protein
MSRITKDEKLQDMSDDQLKRQIQTIRNAIKRKGDARSADLQVELCYFQRESMWRYNRHKFHAEYLKNKRKRYA